MFLRNYYVIPFFAELILGIAVLFNSDLLFIPKSAATGLGLSILVLAAYRFRRMMSRSSGVKSLAISKPVKLKVSNMNPDKKKVFIGKGFVWENKHIQKLYDLSQQESLTKYYDTAKSGGNPAIHGVGFSDEKSICLPTTALSLQTALVGGTGSGKTRLMESLAVQAVLRKEPVIIIDPKGDNELADRIYDVCLNSGRADDFQFFSLAHPKHSNSYNPLDNFSKPTDIASRIRSIMDVKGDTFYADFIWNVVLGVCKGLMALNESITLKNIDKYALGDIKLLFDKVEREIKERKNDHDERMSMLEDAHHHLSTLLDYPGDFFTKVRSNLTPILSSLTYGETGSLLSEVPSDITWEKAINKNRVVYFYLGSMLDATVSKNVGRLALQDFLYYVGSIYAFQRDNDRVPINLFVDEFYNVMFDGYVDLLNKSRGAGVRVTLGMQTSKDIESVTDKARAAQILANTNNKIFLRTPETEIAEMFQDLFGETVIHERMKTISYSPDAKEDGVFFGASAGERLMNKAVPLVDKSYITSLPIGHAFMYTQGEAPYKLRLPLIDGKLTYSFMKHTIEDTSRRSA
jgi:conjugal transfer pilus assembly protein TraD